MGSVLVVFAGAPEPVIDGSALTGFGFGWGLMRLSTEAIHFARPFNSGGTR